MRSNGAATLAALTGLGGDVDVAEIIRQAIAQYEKAKNSGTKEAKPPTKKADLSWKAADLKVGSKLTVALSKSDKKVAGKRGLSKTGKAQARLLLLVDGSGQKWLAGNLTKVQ